MNAPAPLISSVYDEGLFSNPHYRVKTAQRIKGAPVISQNAADEILEQWIIDAKNDQSPDNATKTILSLFDESGVWSAPFVHAGYDVIQLDIQNGVDIAELTNEIFHAGAIDEIHGILAACPCTHFANCGARWFAEKDADGSTQEMIDLVHFTLSIIDYFQPVFWAIENPMGRIKSLCDLPDSRLFFEPFHFGDPYTKKTQLFGRFNPDLPLCVVDPKEGSRIHKLRGDDPRQKKLRSLTPEGFAYAFYRANKLAVCTEDWCDVGLMEISNSYEKNMKDENDKHTTDILADEPEKPKRKPGPKPKSGTALKPAEKMSNMRESIKEMVETKTVDTWNERACIEAMTKKKYEKLKKQAWVQFGKINNYE